jgi:hypothetical protein
MPAWFSSAPLFVFQLNDLSVALDVVRDTKRRMGEISRRVDAVKHTVAGWRVKQIAEAQQLQQARMQQAAAAPATASTAAAAPVPAR